MGSGHSTLPTTTLLCYQSAMSAQHSNTSAPHPINTKSATDRMFCFLTMLNLGKTKRIHMERAVERYADGADAVIRDAQRDKKREREWLEGL